MIKILTILTLLFFTQPIFAQKMMLSNKSQYWQSPKKVASGDAIINLRSLYKVSNKIAANYYTTQTGFFCNQERALEKITKIPLRFRLGSLSYTEQLEGYNP